jgi:hypothetical protein
MMPTQKSRLALKSQDKGLEPKNQAEFVSQKLGWGCVFRRSSWDAAATCTQGAMEKRKKHTENKESKKLVAGRGVNV